MLIFVATLLLANIAISIRLLHQSVTGFVKETLRRLSVLRGSCVKEVIKAFLMLFTFHTALCVALHE